MSLARRERVAGHFCYLVFEQGSLDKTTIHLQIPKKIVTKATDRNLIKRRLRSIITPYRQSLPKSKIIIGIKKDVTPVEFNKIKEDVVNLLNKYVV